MSFEHDMERRLSRASQTNAPANVETYGYDALNRLASDLARVLASRHERLCVLSRRARDTLSYGWIHADGEGLLRALIVAGQTPPLRAVGRNPKLQSAAIGQLQKAVAGYCPSDFKIG